MSSPKVINLTSKARRVLSEEYERWILALESVQFRSIKNRCTDSPGCTGSVGGRYCYHCEGEFLDAMDAREMEGWAPFNSDDEDRSRLPQKKPKNRR